MENNKKNNKRLIYFGLLATLFFILLGTRLYYVQVYQNPKYSQLALKQRSKEISLYPKRGIIYDKNGVPLTNIEKTPTIIIQKKEMQENKNIYAQVQKNTTLSYKEFNSLINSDNYILQIPIKERFAIEEGQNIYFVDMTNRYGKSNPLSHVIGYINKSENSGESGIEKVYDEFLKESEEKSFVIEYDKSRTIILDGAEYVNEITDPNNPAGVKLTIDSKVQTAVEKIMDRENIKGAIVVAEVQTGKILSLASRPNFNQDEIEKYLNNDDMALYNKAIQVGYPPGSVFKIVVLLAALESDYDFINEEFYCPGYEELNNLKINCTKTHGRLYLEEAFSKSCNAAFIQIGKKLKSEKIIQMAQRLNFGKKINIGLAEEISGNLPQGDDLLGPSIGNISIGQGKVEATPLQITNLLMIIANKGIQKHLTLIDGITNKDGKVLKSFNREEDRRVLSESVCDIAYDYLIDVVKNGTGRNIDLQSIGGAGGKTGSAEAILKNTRTIHGWFAGFYPENNPQFVITAIIEEGNSGSKSAAPIFEKIAKELNKIYP